MSSITIAIEKLPIRLIDYWHTRTDLENSELYQYISIPTQIFTSVTEVISGLANVEMKQAKKSKTVVYKLQDYQWSNGDAIIADDYKLWFDVVNSTKFPEKEGNPFVGSKYTKINDKTFEIEFANNYAFAESNNMVEPVPYKLLEEIVYAFCENQIEWKKFRSRIEEIILDKKMFYGPFKIDRYSNNKIEFTKNTFFPKGVGNVHKITYKQMSRDKIYEGITQGEIDIAHGEYRSEFTRVTSFDNNVWVHIDMNSNILSKNILVDVETRRALLQTLDRDGLSNLAGSNFNRRSDGYLQDAAKIDDIGVDSKQLNNKYLEILYPEKQKYYDPIVKYLSETWESFGVFVKFLPVSYEYMFSEKILMHGEMDSFQAMLYASNVNPLFEKADDYAPILNGVNNIPSSLNNYGGNNVSGWRFEPINALYEKLTNTTAQSERHKILLQIQEITLNQAAYIPLLWRDELFTISKKIKNVDFNAFSRDISWNAVDWIVEANNG